MKRFLNTLFITTQGAYLKKDGDAVVLRVEKQSKAKIPLITLDGIVCFGNITVSPFLLGACTEHGISVSFLTRYGRFLSRVQGPVAGNILLRKEQYRIADSEERSAQMARFILTGKIANQKTVLQRVLRDHEEKINAAAVSAAIAGLEKNITALLKTAGLNELRGIEGDSSKIYFSVFNELIIAQKDFFCFHERSRRPPLDRVNAMLSFTYTLLYHDIRSALECSGLDPAAGFLHRDRPGRLSLALDLMEEFRPFFADRLVLSLINRKEITAKQFEITSSGAALMDEAARKILITAYQKKKQAVINHQFIDKKMYIGILFQTQALLMARCIRSDIDGYPPYLWR